MNFTQSIFGIEAPKFVDQDNNEVELDYVVILEDRPVKDIIRNESIVNRHREWTVLGSHWIYRIIVHLFKYGEQAQTKYNELKALERKLVTLYRRRDGLPMKDAGGNDILFLLESVDETYIDTVDYPDVLRLTFKSQDYVVVEDSALS